MLELSSLSVTNMPEFSSFSHLSSAGLLVVVHIGFRMPLVQGFASLAWNVERQQYKRGRAAAALAAWRLGKQGTAFREWASVVRLRGDRRLKLGTALAALRMRNLRVPFLMWHNHSSTRREMKSKVWLRFTARSLSSCLTLFFFWLHLCADFTDGASGLGATSAQEEACFLLLHLFYCLLHLFYLLLDLFYFSLHLFPFSVVHFLLLA